jgi:hypothetical protein
MKIGGGKLQRGAAGVISTLSNDYLRHHDEEGVVHLWTMGLWQYLLYLSLVLHCISLI